MPEPVVHRTRWRLAWWVFGLWLALYGAMAHAAGPGRAPALGDNTYLSSVLTPGSAMYDGTRFRVLREEPAVVGRPRYTVVATDGPAASAAFRLAPGRYRVEARNGAVNRIDTIEVPAEGTMYHEVVLDAGELELSSWLDRTGTPAPQTWFRILRNDRDAYGRPSRIEVAADGYAADQRFLLPAGHYVVEARSGNAVASTGVDVVAGSAASWSFHLDAGHLTLSASLAGDDTTAAAATFELLQPTGEDPSRWETFTRAAPTDETTFLVPAGDYRVRAERDHARAEARVTVKPGEDTRLHLPLEAGVLQVQAVLGGDDRPLRDVRFAVQPLDTSVDGEARAMSGLRGSPTGTAFVLPAGRYRLTAMVTGGNRESVEFAIGAGQILEETIALPAGRVTLALLPDPRQQPLPGTWFSIYRIEQDDQGETRRRRVFNDGYFATTDVVLPAGRYVAFARHHAYRGERTFELATGEIRRVGIFAAP